MEDPNPVSAGPVTFDYVDFEDMNRYLGNMQTEMLAVEVMLDEFTTVSQDWLDGRTNVEWTAAFAQNLLNRHVLLVDQSALVRPTDPGLVEAHLLYEDGLWLLGRAYVVFAGQIPIPDQSLFEGINSDIVEGTLQLVRFQFGVSDVVGQRVRFINL